MSLLPRVMGGEKGCGDAFSHKQDNCSHKICCRGMLATRGRRRCTSTTLFYWTAQGRFAVFSSSFHNPIPRVRRDALLRRCPACWNDLCNRDTRPHEPVC